MKTVFINILIFIVPIFINAQDNLKYAETITVFDLERHLKILASDSLEGRETGKPGQKMAADYIMNHFKNIGIPPYKEKTYYQKFKVESDRHLCKCEDCDSDFIKKLFNIKEYVKGENVLGYIEGTDLNVHPFEERPYNNIAELDICRINIFTDIIGDIQIYQQLSLDQYYPKEIKLSCPGNDHNRNTIGNLAYWDLLIAEILKKYFDPTHKKQ